MTWKRLSALMFAIAAVLLATGSLVAQTSPFDGIWVADVPSPDGERLRFVLQLSVEGSKIAGTLQIGDTKPVPIENGSVRGDVLSFRRNLGEGEGAIQFLARVIDDGLRVGFMHRPKDDEPRSGGSSQVVNFTARRMRSPH